jgi:hypothetical protein
MGNLIDGIVAFLAAIVANDEWSTAFGAANDLLVGYRM